MRLLAVFSHPDDELGCVGTLAKHAARGDEVLLVWTTHGELASQFTQDRDEVRRIRQEHGAKVAGRIGASAHFFDMGDSRMTGGRTEALQLARLYARFQPDAIITWNDDSPHPDHRMTARIAFDAITLARIPRILDESHTPDDAPAGDADDELEPHRRPVAFYQYASHASTRPLVHVDISEQIELACEIFTFYQEFFGWSYSLEDFRTSRRINGREAGVKYADKLQLRRAFAPAVAYLQ